MNLNQGALSMAQLRPLDPSFPITRQLAVAASPVVLVNVFTVDAADVDALLKAWEKDALWMKQQPGFISTQLHRAIGDSYVLMNYAVWESVDHFRQAFTNPAFQRALEAYPESAVISPHLFQKMTVANLCVA
jgi:quinol monooxygenase YgiN